MNYSSTVPKDLLYLGLAVLSIRFILLTRRLLYIHHIYGNKKRIHYFIDFYGPDKAFHTEILGQPGSWRYGNFFNPAWKRRY